MIRLKEPDIEALCKYICCINGENVTCNSASLLNFVTNDIYAFSEDHRMELNPILNARR